MEKYINSLVRYGITKGLITHDDSVFVANRLLELMGHSGWSSFLYFQDVLGEIKNRLIEWVLAKFSSDWVVSF